MDKEITLATYDELTNWQGIVLRPEVRKIVTVKHVVRIVIQHPSGYSEAIYIKITEEDGNKLKGVVLDTYRHGEDHVKNGEVVTFTRANITEIPTGDVFPENSNIDLSSYKTDKKKMTGV